MIPIRKEGSDVQIRKWKKIKARQNEAVLYEIREMKKEGKKT